MPSSSYLSNAFFSAFAFAFDIFDFSQTEQRVWAIILSFKDRKFREFEYIYGVS